MDISSYNRQAWDNYVAKQNRWTIPVTEQELDKAAAGDWQIVLTPTKPVPHNWFPDLKGSEILCLASGGGQQGPVLAAAGAAITVFDNSDGQLAQDRIISDTYNLNIKTVQGDMRDLSAFTDASFDVVFNPCSTTFIDDVLPVWRECFRVLKPGGILMTGFSNPIMFLFEEEKKDVPFNPSLVYSQPYSDLKSLPKEKLDEYIRDNEALIFGHSLTDQIGGQLQAGFMLTAMFEDDYNGQKALDAYFPSFIATRAIKP